MVQRIFRRLSRFERNTRENVDQTVGEVERSRRRPGMVLAEARRKNRTAIGSRCNHCGVTT